MSGSWYRYREAVEWLKDRDIIAGYEDGTFKPKDTINRAELLKLVMEREGKTYPKPRRRCFSDVAPRLWYAPFVCAAKEQGIVKGYANGQFQPGDPVNIAESIKIILLAEGKHIEEPKGREWYAPYVEELDTTDVLDASSYLPWAPLTRERAADVLWRVLRHKEEGWNPRLSSGCSQPGTIPTTVTVNGIERSFLLTSPGGSTPKQLIVAFQGRTNDNADVRSYMRLDRTMTDAVIAYPAALSNGNGTFSWNDPGNRPNETRDIAFFDAIVETVAEHTCIDMNRITVVGHSLGAWMANTVACVRGDAVRASATVGGDMAFTDCAGPAAAFIAHNPKDTLAPFTGAVHVREHRAQANMCPWEVEKVGPSTFHCERHIGCPGDNDIWFCPHAQDIDERGKFYPHTWPRETAGVIREFLEGLR
jgi:polyhydroxybutyrate depolymerase